MHRFVSNKFLSQYKATIGADFSSKEVIVDGKAIALQVWDTAGQERYQSLGVAFYKGTECCFLVYDVTNPKSFTSLDNWKSEFLRQAAPNNPDTFPFIVLGNKADRLADKKVNDEKVKVWCNETKMPFFLTSAKDQINVIEAFNLSAELSIKNQPEATQNATLSKKRGQKLTKKAKKEDQCC